MGKEFKSEIVEIFGVLSETEKSQKVLCSIRWGDKDPRTEIRVIQKDGKYGSGISLSEEEAERLEKLLKDRSVFKKHKPKKREEVDFSKIFSTAGKSHAIREEGFTSEDGLIKLTRRT